MVPKKKIVIHIQSEVQFFTLEPLLVKLSRSKKYDFDIVVNDYGGDDSGWKEMASGVVSLILKNGYRPKNISSCVNKRFDLCLTPYIDERIKAKCYLKYEYGTLNVKPNLTYVPEVMSKFHGFLCQSTITRDLLEAYGRTFPVDNLRFCSKKRKIIKRKRPQVLFAPTYNDDSSDKDFIEIIRTLKKNYYVVVKGHHGTGFLKDESGKKDALCKTADKYYGSDACLSDLILESDVCLFDNSSAIGEALYAKVPCAIIAKDLDYFKLEDIHTTQFQFVRDGYIPYSNKSSDALLVIGKALKDDFIEKQKELSNKVFPKEFKTGVDGYLRIIDYFMDDEIAQDYIKLHNLRIKNENALKNELIKCKEELTNKDSLLQEYANRKLYKLSDKIYNIKGKIRHGKS